MSRKIVGSIHGINVEVDENVPDGQFYMLNDKSYVISPNELTEDGDTPLMSGQEWYDRFSKELKDSYPPKVIGHAPMFKSMSEVDYREQAGYNFGYADGNNHGHSVMIEIVERSAKRAAGIE